MVKIYCNFEMKSYVKVRTFRCHPAAALSLTFLGTIPTNHFGYWLSLQPGPAAQIKWKISRATGFPKSPRLSECHCMCTCLSVWLLISNLPSLLASQINAKAAGSHSNLHFNPHGADLQPVSVWGDDLLEVCKTNHCWFTVLLKSLDSLHNLPL